MARLNGKVALISEGAKGMIADLCEKEIPGLGPLVTYLQLDVTRLADWDAIVATVVKTYGKLDVLVNNAGIVTFGLIKEYTHADWEKIIAINLAGVFNGIKAALPGYTAPKFGILQLIHRRLRRVREKGLDALPHRAGRRAPRSADRGATGVAPRYLEQMPRSQDANV
jgi:NAD(P)-dependent dehydrogenase (short-subunit alcohol dehydrogenase family)